MADKASAFDDMIDACQIFKKYSTGRRMFNCDHDVIVCVIEFGEVSGPDRAALAELGWHEHEDLGSFYSVRHGSC